MCLFDSNDSVLLFSENKYDDDDDMNNGWLQTTGLGHSFVFPSVLWHCYKNIRPLQSLCGYRLLSGTHIGFLEAGRRLPTNVLFRNK